jgi:hypothetical protein
MAKALTRIAIDNFKPGPARREVPDGKVNGLYFVIQPTGRMAWALRYRLNGKPCKLTIRAYPAIGLSRTGLRFGRIEAKASTAATEGRDTRRPRPATRPKLNKSVPF